MLPQTSHTSRKCGKSPQALYQRTKIVLRYKHVTQKQCVCRCVFGWMCFYICMCVCAFIGAYCPSGYNETLKISVLRAPSSVMSKMCHSATYSTSQAPTQQSILTPLTALCPKLSVCNQHYWSSVQHANVHLPELMTDLSHRFEWWMILSQKR